MRVTPKVCFHHYGNEWEISKDIEEDPRVLETRRNDESPCTQERFFPNLTKQPQL